MKHKEQRDLGGDTVCNFDFIVCVLQAERELLLSRKMLQWRAWEPLIAEAPQNQWKWPV